MIHTALTHTRDLISTLREIEKETEEVFLNLADALPRLVHEMQASFAHSEEEVKALDARSGDAGSTAQDCAVCDVMTSTRQTLLYWLEKFETLNTEDATLFERLRSSITYLEKISRSIEQIKGDSEDMELVSINAMTVAIKAGSAGRAFSYITEELKRLSARTITLTDTISLDGEDLTKVFAAFERDLEETGTLQREILASMKQRVFQSIDDFAELVAAIVERSRDLQRQSRELQEPVHRMMEAIQLQDIIRQSIDHIILALEVITPEEELPDDDALLDEITFLRDIPPLAMSLIEDVAQQTETSMDTFLTLAREAEDRLARLEQERRSFIGDHLKSASGRELSFAGVLDHLSEVLEQITADLDRNMDRKESLAGRSSVISNHVEQLQTHFKAFDSLVTRFHSIDIAARIEVAKQKVLRDMGNATDQMTELTRTIESDVEQSLETTNAFIDSAAAIREHHHELYHQEKRAAAEFRTAMTQRYEEINRNHHALMTTVQDFSLFSDKFFEVFSHCREYGQQLAHAVDRIRSLKKPLESMEEAIQGRYRALLAERNLESWSIEDTRLREIIDRFTIFTHKKKAGDMAGFEVETGVETGEITFF